MNGENRIEQFKKMAEADPTNELGHFSLAKAYLGDSLFDEAAQSFTKAIELNANMSKAYHLLGEALDKLNRRDDAIEWMQKGLQVADRLGDRAPRKAMAELLTSWGVEVASEPAGETASASSPISSSADGFRCSRCSSPTNQLPKPPFKGALGEKIHANVCNSCWKEWVPMGTKVINELGLGLASQAGQDTYDQYMVEFLQLEETAS